eukprot:scaffold469573_cov43-Prasinocladus_malaysianus.AAC.1
MALVSIDALFVSMLDQRGLWDHTIDFGPSVMMGAVTLAAGASEQDDQMGLSSRALMGGRPGAASPLAAIAEADEE